MLKKFKMREMDIAIFGNPEIEVVFQMDAVVAKSQPDYGVICADNHLGYSIPVGAVVAYKDKICVNGVGYDIACLDAETEFLSPDGWIRIDEYNGQMIAQYCWHTEEATFVKPKYIKLPMKEDFYHLKSQSIDQMVSADHRLLLYKGKKFEDAFIMKAQDYVDQHDQAVQGASYKFNTAFNIKRETSLPFTDAELRVIVMTCADGYLIKKSISNKCVVSVKKQRKAERCHNLLREARIDFLQSQTKGGYTNYRFVPPLYSKSLDSLWDASPHQIQVIVDEVFHWDGNEKDRVYFTRDKFSADFIHYAFACCGYRSVMREDYKDEKIDYRVFAVSNSKTGLKTVPKKGFKDKIARAPSKDGFQYCFQVPSSFFVTRRNGKIAITGNCGNKAVKLNLKGKDIKPNMYRTMNEVQKHISFGIGRHNEERVEHELFDSETWYDVPMLKNLKDKARAQLGTVGGGNHYVDIFTDEHDDVWIGVHFGSRGLGHTVATYFVEKGGGKDGVHADPVIFDVTSDLGVQYIKCMQLAGQYAYAGRDWVCARVAQILRGEIVEEIHNHHNFAWKENHFDQDYWVVRKGATPAFPGQKGFVGGTMADSSFILEGIENDDARSAMYSTIHGAGRKLGRTAAKGKKDKRGNITRPGLISKEQMMEPILAQGIELRGADVDEAHQAYKQIDEVIWEHINTVKILHRLTPMGVCMADARVYDPYKD